MTSKFIHKLTGNLLKGVAEEPALPGATRILYRRRCDPIGRLSYGTIGYRPDGTHEGVYAPTLAEVVAKMVATKLTGWNGQPFFEVHEWTHAPFDAERNVHTECGRYLIFLAT